MILRARVVLPISRPAIEDGAVWISRGRIRSAIRWRDRPATGPGQLVDLGEALLMPGLINAHSHLDYTHMAGQIPPPKLFSDWLKVMVSTKAGWGLADYRSSWKAGAQMLLRTGTTTVGDIEAIPDLLPGMWEETPLRVLSFLEMIGITRRREPAAILQEAQDKIASLGKRKPPVGFSPHAPYSTLPELLRRTAWAARRPCRLICIHVAESALEDAMFSQAEGPMFEWLQRSGRDMADCGVYSPVKYLEQQGLLGSNVLAVHANYLRKGDAAILAKHKVSVVHCPRSYQYFQHEGFALNGLARAGVNICLGTDSLATVLKRKNENIQLDMFAELRALTARESSLSAKTILKMATIHGARALGLAGQVGELTPGAMADLIVLPCEGQHTDPYAHVMQHSDRVLASMIGGRWAIPPAT
jgi:cytosine/adenosine deaminase-related metal-dependent hydrolase